MESLGKLYTLIRYTPLILLSSDTVWFVQSGAIDIFIIPSTIKNQDEQRRYLFTITSGQILFGVHESDKYNQLLAIPTEDSILERFNFDNFYHLISQQIELKITWIEKWLQQINSSLLAIIKSNIDVQGKEFIRYSLEPNQSFQMQKDIWSWVEIEQGEVKWMGNDNFTFTSADGNFPLGGKMLLTAIDDVQLVIQPLQNLPSSQCLLKGLSKLNSYFLRYIDILEQESKEKELLRLVERQFLDAQVMGEALAHLGSTLNPGTQNVFFSNDSLLIVAGAIGRALGVKIYPPLQSENIQRVKDPLEAIARSSRLRLRSVVLRGDWWNQDSDPIVAYTKENHCPIALLPHGNKGYTLLDPIDQVSRPVSKDIAEKLESIAYIFYRPFSTQIKNVWTILQFAFKNQQAAIKTIFLISAAVTLLGMLTPQATAIIINNAIPDSDRSVLFQIGIGLFVAAFGTSLFQLTQGFTVLRIETNSDMSTQAALWDQLLKLPVSFFRQYSTGDLTNRVSSISTIRRQLGGRTLLNLFTNFFGVFYLGQLFYYNNKLAIVAVIVSILTVSVTSFFGVVLVGYVRSLLDLEGYIFGQTVQLIHGITKLHVSRAQERAFSFWSKHYSEQIKLELNKQQVEDAVALFNTLMPTLTSGIIFGLTAQLIRNAESSSSIALSLGTFLAFNAAFGIFIRESTSLSNTITEALQVLPQWKRTKPILETSPEVDFRKIDPGNLRGNIRIKDVSFRYYPNQPLILDKINLDIKEGEFIALVGNSGSGKSTLFRLLLGFETPEDGDIYYEEQNLLTLDIESLRRQLGVVLQSGQLFSASIFENIACGAKTSLDEVWEAASLAGIADDILAMPMQLYTIISEGSTNISVGQRQRLLIARALILKPKILLFDEATSALDNHTQDLVSKNLENLHATRIVIAHRLSTIRHADCIYVFNKGQVIQKGNFEELASQDGLFSQLMARQIV
jgi:ATP-binding cassette subfamily C protein